MFHIRKALIPLWAIAGLLAWTWTPASPAWAQDEPESVSAAPAGSAEESPETVSAAPAAGSGPTTDAGGAAAADDGDRVDLVPTEAVGELKLGFLPFFTADASLNEAAVEAFGRWLEGAAESDAVGDQFAEIQLDWIDEGSFDESLFQQLPSSRARGAVEILAPVAADGEVDGILAAWATQSRGTPEVVMLLYLPERIRVEQYRTSVNFERSRLEAANGEYRKKDVRASMEELLLRNLGRIAPLESRDHSPAETKPPTAPAPSSGDGTDAADEESVPAGGSDGAPTFVILEFSREFLMAPERLRERYSGLPMQFPFRGEASRFLTETYGGSRVDAVQNSQPVTFDQAEAPVLDLDPDADPRAKEKALLARAGPRVDALFYGHVHQERKKKDYELRVTTRLLLRDGYQTLRQEHVWPEADRGKPVSESQVRRAFWGGIRSLLVSAGLFSPTDDVAPDTGSAPQAGDIKLITVVRGDTVSKVVRRCYGVPRSESYGVAKQLCAHNELGLVECDDIEEDDVLRLPRRLDSWTRNDSQCSSR